jgi:hypothetical protein
MGLKMSKKGIFGSYKDEENAAGRQIRDQFLGKQIKKTQQILCFSGIF